MWFGLLKEFCGSQTKSQARGSTDAQQAAEPLSSISIV